LQLEIVLERNEKYTGQKASVESGSKAKSKAKTETVGTEAKSVANASDSNSQAKFGEDTASKEDTKEAQSD